MVAGAACESHRNNSCTINTVTGNQKNLLRGLFQKESSRNNTLPKRRKKGTVPPSLAFPSRPLKALQISLSEALFQPSLHLSVNAADRSVPFSKTTKKGQGKGLIFKKVPFSPLFFFFINIFSFRSNLKCMDEVNYFFIVYLSFFIFNLFCYLFIFFIRNKVALPPFSIFFVSIAQTGTILPCICCIWDSIPWTLVRILFWCAAEEMPMRAMSSCVMWTTASGVV